METHITNLVNEKVAKIKSENNMLILSNIFIFL